MAITPQAQQDTRKLAEFIVALGQFNGYGSTTAQTLRALELGSVTPLRDDNDDRVIFTDIVKAINAVSGIPFSVQSSIDINAQFTGDSPQQPSRPGVLRHREEDPIRNNILIKLWPGSAGDVITYIPPANVDEWDLQKIVDEFNSSQGIHAGQGREHTDKDGWILFAKLAKLQPFQDGNKRTALLAANHALGALESHDYLMPPTGAAYQRFTTQLLEYYGTGLEGSSFNSEKAALAAFLDVAVGTNQSRH